MKKLSYTLILGVLLVMLLYITGHKNIAHAQEPVNGISEGYKIIEGDIIVPEDFGNADGIGIQSAFGDTSFWPNGIVPFQFDTDGADSVNGTQQNQMLAAMALWENVANIDFRPRNGEGNFIRIRNSSNDTQPANNSQVGMQGGQQTINIVSWNNQWIIAHELAHALGVWHEQSRPDRNNYIEIIEDNIQAGNEHNFALRAAADVYPKQAYGLAGSQTYDFDSVMHYSQCAFSNGPCPPNVTITVLPPNQAWQTQIGQLTHLSDLDQLAMSFLYPENNWRFVESTYAGSENGTFLEPYRDYKQGFNSTPSGGTLWIQPGRYSGIGIYSKPTTLRAPLGSITIGP